MTRGPQPRTEPLRPTYSGWSREDLLDRVYELEALNGSEFVVHPTLRFTGLESKMLGVLIARDITSHTQFMNLIWADNPREPNIVIVFLSKLRKKLRPHGIEIKNMRDAGWYMTREHRVKAAGLSIKTYEASNGRA